MIIGLTGVEGSGKSTVANYLCEEHRFITVSFAESLKNVLSEIFDWDRELLEGITNESRIWRETVDNYWSKKLNIPGFTPRFAMQYIGTDLFRNHFNKDIWILSLRNKLEKYSYKDNIVISDIRFDNETNMIRELDGKILLITKNESRYVYYDDEKYDYKIENTSTKEILYERVDHIMSKILLK